MNAKIKNFAARVEAETRQRYKDDGLTSPAHEQSMRVSIKDGKKYTKVDVGSSGKYMIDKETGIIYGIKGYGQVHKGHIYGTLDTIGDYNWGGYTAIWKTVTK